MRSNNITMIETKKEFKARNKASSIETGRIELQNAIKKKNGLNSKMKTFLKKHNLGNY